MQTAFQQIFHLYSVSVEVVQRLTDVNKQFPSPGTGTCFKFHEFRTLSSCVAGECDVASLGDLQLQL